MSTTGTWRHAQRNYLWTADKSDERHRNQGPEMTMAELLEIIPDKGDVIHLDGFRIEDNGTYLIIEDKA